MLVHSKGDTTFPNELLQRAEHFAITGGVIFEGVLKGANQPFGTFRSFLNLFGEI